MKHSKIDPVPAEAPAGGAGKSAPGAPCGPLPHALLYLTEFFSGMAVMAAELGASRLLAPYFSSSQIVWTIIIGIIMIAMAAGNLYGGRTADRAPSPRRVYRRILIAALWLAAIPVVGRYIILAVSGLLVFAVDTGYLVLAAFVSCLLLFVFPLFLLGTVTPSLVRGGLASLDESGRLVGRLSACNTVGSIIGTFLPTFVTIPAWGTSVSFLIFSGVLLALSLVYYLFFEKEKRRSAVITAVASVLAFALCCALGHSPSAVFWRSDMLYEGESVYNYLLVEEDERRVSLSTNVLFGVQSVAPKEGESLLTGMYYDYALAAPALASGGDARSPLSVLVLGGGTCTFGRQCLAFFPACAVESVEIDRKIIDLSREYFALPPEVAVTEYDARAYLAASNQTYDVILVDAYQDITIPPQMSSREFFTLVREHLSPGGVLAVNLNMRGSEGGESEITSALEATVASVFREVLAADVPGNTNRVLLACEEGSAEDLSRAARRLSGEAGAFLSRAAPAFHEISPEGQILTDDRAPVELLGMRAIDGIIAEQLGLYKEVLRESGIRGLLEVLGVLPAA